jgi:cytochrome P450
VTTTASRPITPNPDFVLLRAYRGIFWDRIKLLKRTAKWHPYISSATLGKRELIFINRPEYLHQVFVEQADKFHKSPEFKFFVKPLLGNGLLLSEDEEHTRNRKLVAPAFVHRRIREYAHVMTDYTQRIISEWKMATSLIFRAR